VNIVVKYIPIADFVVEFVRIDGNLHKLPGIKV